MAQPSPLGSLSATRLKALKTAETITILYKPTTLAEPLILCEAFPKGVATTFSSKWRVDFPPVNKMTVADLRKPTRKSVTIVGGRFNIHKDILAWMSSCCDGRGIQKFPYPSTNKPFTYLYFTRACAAIMGCESLEKEVTKAMERIANAQIHSEDVRALWLLNNPPDEDMQKFLAEHVAIRIWEKRLKAKGAYTTLREEIPEFNRAIDEILALKKAERKSEKGAVAQVEDNKKPAPPRRRQEEWRSSNPQNWRATVVSRRAQNPKGEDVNTGTIKAEVVKTGKIRAEVVRRGSNGRPTFARLDLEDLGVTKDGFRGQTY